MEMTSWLPWIVSSVVTAISLSASVFYLLGYFSGPKKETIKKQRPVPAKLLGIKTLYPSPSGPASTRNCTIDILAVHGLGADPATTWTAKRDTDEPVVKGSGRNKADYINWLSDPEMLPKGLPNARIMVFNHDTRWWGEEAVASRLDPLAKELIGKLRVARKDCANRPLIFIGHSLGGLIIEKAMVHPMAPKDLFSAVTSVILLGTPHGGTKYIGFPEILQRIRDSGTHIDRGLINSLQPENENILDTVNHFAELANRGGISVDCFYETKQSVIAKMFAGDTEKAVIVDEKSATLRSWPCHQLALDHFNLNKFSDPEDGNWETVQRIILERCVEAAGNLQVRLEAQQIPRSLLPYNKDPNFIGRRGIIDEIQELFKKTDWIALHGPGGVGKSQIAIQYAYEFQEKNPQSWVFWVFAGTVDKFEQAFKEIALNLKLQGSDDPKVDTLSLVTKWLNKDRPNNSWLMILDNFDDVGVLFPDGRGGGEEREMRHKRNLSAAKLVTRKSLHEYLPERGRGNILVTTRVLTAAMKLVGQNDRIVKVPNMSPKEAYDLLQVKLPSDLKGTQQDACAELVDSLDRLPLAISQASGYLGMNPQLTVANYLEYFNDQQNQAELLDEEGVEERREKFVPSSVRGTWLISFNQIAQQEGPKGKKAIELLYLMSFFDRHNVPSWLLSDGNELQFQGAIGKLAGYCLIIVERGKTSYDMHRLVGILARNQIEVQNETERWKLKAVERLEKRFPSGEFETWKECRELIPHFQAVKDYKLKDGLSEEPRASLFAKKACYDGKIGMWEAVRQGRLEELEIRRTLTADVFKDHSALRAMDKLAWANFITGNVESAVSMAKRVLDCLRELLGDKYAVHEDYLEMLNNLAFMTDDEVLSKEAFEGRRTVLGDHELTAESLNNHAVILTNHGKYELALQPNEEALALMTKIHKSDPAHSHILWCRSVRWNILAHLERFNEAQEIAEDVLKIRKSVLGLSHIDTIESLADCTDTSLLIQDYKSAEDFAIQCLDAASKHPELGDKHLKTVEYLRDLALAQKKQDKMDEAYETYKKALSTAEATLVGENEDVWLCRVTFGTLLVEEDKADEAFGILKSFLAVVKTKGIAQEELLNESFQLATALWRFDHLDESEILLEAIVDGYRSPEIQGPEGYDTRRAIDQLGLVYRKRGKLPEAEKLLQSEHELRMQHLGPDDQCTMYSRRILIEILSGLGKVAEADAVRMEELSCFNDSQESSSQREGILHELGRVLYFENMLEDAERVTREVVESRRKTLGNDGLETLKSTHLLGAILTVQGRPEESEPLYRDIYERRMALLGPEDPWTVVAQNDLLAALKEQGKTLDGEQIEEREATTES